jgi:hypothetical protein
MTAHGLTRIRDGAILGAVAVLVLTAVRALARMGPAPDGTCASSPTCPNAHQWTALLVLAAACGLAALLGLAWVLAGGRSQWRVALVALALAAALLVVDPAGHLNGPDANWFGHSLSDGSLN